MNKREEFRKLKRNPIFLEELKKYEHYKVLTERITKNGTLLTGFELHHIIPLKDNGTNEPNNLIWIPKSIHRLLIKKEGVLNTRDSVIKFCKQYTTNKKTTTDTDFNNYIEENTFNQKEWMKDYYVKNKNHLNEYNRKHNKEYYTKNKETILKKQKESYIKNKELKKEYYENNKEMILKKQKENNTKHKGRIKKSKKKYTKTLKGQIRIKIADSKAQIKKSTKLTTKMKNLFKYQCLHNEEKTKNSFWIWKNNKIEWTF